MTLEDQVKQQFSLDSGDFVIGRLSRGVITKLAKMVVTFSEALADTPLYKYQQEFGTRVVMSLLLDDGEEITALFCRQSGKSETLAVIINGIIVLLPILARYIKDPRIQKFRKGVFVGIFAPAYKQASIIHSRVLGKLHSDHAKKILADEEIGIFFDDKRETAQIRLPNGSLCDCNSAAKQARIEGKTYHMIVIEEAQDVDPYVYRKSISPMGASTNATSVKIGTCNMRRSDFYEAVQRNAKRDADAGRGVLRHHFQFDYTTAVKYNQFYKKYVKKEEARLGFDSDEFRMSYRLHWILERGMFVEPTAFELMGKDYSPVAYDPVNQVVLSVDVGKIEASTVVTALMPDYNNTVEVAEGDFRSYKRVLNWLELRGDDYTIQVKQVAEFARNYKKAFRMIVDCTGVGVAFMDMLRKELGNWKDLELIEFTATTQSNTDLYRRFLLDLQSFRIEYPDSARAKKLSKQRNFITQMTNLQKVYNGAMLGAEAGAATPNKDFCSSLALGCLACDSRDTLGSIEQDVNNLFSRSSFRAGRSSRNPVIGSRNARQRNSFLR